MSNDPHSRIEQRAREIWEREGRPEGRDEEHWRLAEAELEREAAEEGARAQAQRETTDRAATTAKAAEEGAVVAKVEEEAKPKVKAAEAAKTAETKPLATSTAEEKKPATTKVKRANEPKKAPTKKKE